MADHYRYLLGHGRTKAVPLWFRQRPQPSHDLLFFWDAFWDLSTERQLGMSMGPIPRISIKRYADEAGFDDEQYDMFRRLMRTMDAIYMKMILVRPTVNEDD